MAGWPGRKPVVANCAISRGMSRIVGRRAMGDVVGIVVDSLMLSSIYILVSLGFALVLSIIGILNFVHGALYMIGGYVCYWFSTACGLNQWLALLLTAIVLAGVGLFLERFCFRPFLKNENRTIITAIGLILVLETTINISAGGVTRSTSGFVPGMLKTGVLIVSAERVSTLVISGLLLVAVTLFIGKTKSGQQMLAVSQGQEGAEGFLSWERVMEGERALEFSYQVLVPDEKTEICPHLSPKDIQSGRFRNGVTQELDG